MVFLHPQPGPGQVPGIPVVPGQLIGIGVSALVHGIKIGGDAQPRGHTRDIRYSSSAAALVQVGPQHHRDLRTVVLQQAVALGRRDHHAVDDRGAEAPRDLGHGVGALLHQGRHRQAAQLIQRAAAQSLGGLHAVRRRLVEGDVPLGLEHVTALADGPVNQPLPHGHGHDVAHRGRAGALPGNGHAARVAAKGGDVLLHPAERSQLIQ